MSSCYVEKTLGREFGAGTVEMRFSIRREDKPCSPQISLDVWFFSNDGADPFLVVSPKLDITVHPRMGLNSWGQDAFRLPVLPGGFNQSGGLAARQAVVWSPFVCLSSEDVIRLDGMCHREHGFHIEFGLQAAVVGLQSIKGRDEMVIAGAAPLIWHDQLHLTAQDWRDMLATWGWPRPRLFELQPSSFCDLAAFEIAHRKMQDAQRHLSVGAWQEAVADSRQVVEAVLRHLGYKEVQGRRIIMRWQEMEAAGFPVEVADLLKAFNAVTSLQHHPTADEYVWSRADARFLVQIAASLAEYVGSLPPFVVPPTT